MDIDELASLFNGTRENPVWICNIEQRLAGILESKTRSIWLSAETMKKQKLEHPELVFEDYLQLPHLILHGLAYCNRSAQIRFIIQPRERERGLMSVIKRTKHGDEIFVVSFHYLRIRKFMSWASKPIIVRNPYDT